MSSATARTRRLLAAALLPAVALGLTACTIGSDSSSTTEAGTGSIAKIDALSGVKLRVGSKEFDEQLVLGQIALSTLRAVGASPEDKTNITGTDNVRRALTGNEIDLYWEYTGTAWVNFLKQTSVITDPVELFDAVKKDDAANQITWWSRAPANDTYAIAANSEAAAKNNVTTISQFAALAKSNPAEATICLGPEFKSRDDGFPGVEKTYGFTLPDSSVKVVNDSIVFTEAGKGQTCKYGSVAATDGRVLANKLVLLQDDKKFFPTYNPAISMRTDQAGKYPELEKVFDQVAAELTDEVLTGLNKQVSVDGKKAADVADAWMRSEGFIE